MRFMTFTVRICLAGERMVVGRKVGWRRLLNSDLKELMGGEPIRERI